MTVPERKLVDVPRAREMADKELQHVHDDEWEMMHDLSDAVENLRAENAKLRDALHVFLDAHAEQGPMTQLSDYLVDKAKRALTDQEPDGCYDPHGMEE
jgi:hypothetical protein